MRCYRVIRAYGLNKLQPAINDGIGRRISISEWPILVTRKTISCERKRPQGYQDGVRSTSSVGRTWNSMPILTIEALSYVGSHTRTTCDTFLLFNSCTSARAAQRQFKAGGSELEEKNLHVKMDVGIAWCIENKEAELIGRHKRRWVPLTHLHRSPCLWYAGRPGSYKT